MKPINSELFPLTNCLNFFLIIKSFYKWNFYLTARVRIDLYKIRDKKDLLCLKVEENNLKIFD